MTDDLDDLDELQAAYVEFLRERGWEQFHTPQNVAQALSVEASELLELFLWHDNVGADRVAADDDLREDVRMELADVLLYSLSMAHALDVDLLAAAEEKLVRNEARFDPETAGRITRETRRWQRE